MKISTKYIIVSLSIVALVAIDLLTKSIFDGKVMGFIDGFVGIEGTTHNYGAGFSILENQIALFVLLAVVFIGVFIFYEYRTRRNKKNVIYYIGTGLILGGTIGNAIDRVMLGYVRDFINLEFMDFPIFNLADVWLTVGVIFFAIYLLFFFEKDEKINKSISNDEDSIKDVNNNDTNNTETENINDKNND